MLETGGKIVLGTRVRTGAVSRCEFRTRDGSEVRLNGDTEVLFAESRRLEIDKGQILARVMEAAAPFQVTLNHVATFRGGDPPPLVLLGDEGVIGAELLHTAIHRALVTGSMAPRREPKVWPHVSLLWDRSAIPRTFVEPIGWTAREFVLLDSLYGEGRHEVLGRWPLLG